MEFLINDVETVAHVSVTGAPTLSDGNRVILPSAVKLTYDANGWIGASVTGFTMLASGKLRAGGKPVDFYVSAIWDNTEFNPPWLRELAAKVHERLNPKAVAVPEPAPTDEHVRADDTDEVIYARALAGRIESTANRLHRVADNLRGIAERLTRHGTRSTYASVAAEVISDVMWGSANAHLGELAADAYLADIARVKGQ